MGTRDAPSQSRAYLVGGRLAYAFVLALLLKGRIQYIDTLTRRHIGMVLFQRVMFIGSAAAVYLRFTVPQVSRFL